MDNKPTGNYQAYKQWLMSKKGLDLQTERNREEITKCKETNGIYH